MAPTLLLLLYHEYHDAARDLFVCALHLLSPTVRYGCYYYGVIITVPSTPPMPAMHYRPMYRTELNTGH